MAPGAAGAGVRHRPDADSSVLCHEKRQGTRSGACREDRYFMTRVTAITGRNATVATCDDGSKFKQENPSTGTVNLAFAPTPGQGYLFETWRMAQLHGHWAITAASVAVLPSRSAEPCQPGMTGYGPSRRPAVAALLRQVSATLGAASSVHGSGTIQQGGKPPGLTPRLAASGEFSGPLPENGTVFTALATHGHAYVKLSPAFLRIAPLPATACSRFCGEYLQYPAARAHVMFAQVNMAGFTRSLTSAPASGVKLLGAVAIGGQLAWLL